MKTVMSADINIELEEETQTTNGLSSDERYDDEDDSDDSCEERELSVSFDHDTVSTTDTFNSDTSLSLTTPSSG